MFGFEARLFGIPNADNPNLRFSWFYASLRCMKQYVIDELRPSDHKRLKQYLDENFVVSDLGGLYWVPLEPEILTACQAEHRKCQPHYFALELLPDRLACELLVRTRNSIRCECIQYATDRQRNWLIDLIDAIFEKLELKT